MNLKERTLYHQVHPAKLLADSSTGAVALVLLWEHDLLPALLVLSIPPILVSVAIISWVDLEGRKRSRLGEYLRRYMTGATQAARLVGFVIMALGAWYHQPWALVLGIAIILLAWLRGFILPGRARLDSGSAP